MNNLRFWRRPNAPNWPKNYCCKAAKTRLLKVAAIWPTLPISTWLFKTDAALEHFKQLEFCNSGVDELKQALNALAALLKKGGRLIVVSFHSLEDAIVKIFKRAGRFEQNIFALPAFN